MWQALLTLGCGILHLALGAASSEVGPLLWPNTVLGVLSGAPGLQVELSSHA